MKLLKNIRIVDLGLYLEKEKILILCDFHIGYEEYLNEKGVLIPRFQFESILERLGKIFDGLEVEKIIINGDLKHEFGKISVQEWRHVLGLLDFLLEKGNVVLVKGNHDKILEPIAKKREIEIVDEFRKDGLLVTHGDKLKELEKVVVIGHEHPAISFNERKFEKYKCFLLGDYEKSKLIVQPSFNLVVEGSDVSNNKLLSPFLKDVSNFEVFIVEDKVYRFGKVKDFF